MEKSVQSPSIRRAIDSDGLCKREMGRAETFSSLEWFSSDYSRLPFTSQSQVDADLALARALQQQEKAYMLLHMHNEGSGYEEHVNDADNIIQLHSQLLQAESGLPLSSQEQQEIDGAQYETDEAFARALQEAEDKEATAQIIALAVGRDDDEDSNESQDAWQDVDPDNMSYEELVALGEAVGTQSKGLNPDVIAALPCSKYASENKTSASAKDLCVICHLDYGDGDFLLTLPCKHHYHADCIKSWLQINKVCPVCSAEVTSPEYNS